MHSETAEQLESIAVSLTQIVAKFDGRGNASAGNASMPMQYAVQGVDAERQMVFWQI